MRRSVAVLALCGLLSGCVSTPEFSPFRTDIRFDLGDLPDNAQFRAKLRRVQHERVGKEMGLNFSDMQYETFSEYEASAYVMCEGLKEQLEPLIAQAAEGLAGKDAILEAYRKTYSCDGIFIMVH